MPAATPDCVFGMWTGVLSAWDGDMAQLKQWIEEARVQREFGMQHSASLHQDAAFPNTVPAAIALSQIEVDCFNRSLQHLSFFKYDQPARGFLHIPAAGLDWISNYAPFVPMMLGLNRRYGDDRPE